jgi:hypothetical protein
MEFESGAPIITEKSYRYNFTNEGGVDHTFRVVKTSWDYGLSGNAKNPGKTKGIIPMSNRSTWRRRPLHSNHSSIRTIHPFLFRRMCLQRSPLTAKNPARTPPEVNSLAEIRRVIQLSIEIQTYRPHQTDEWNEAYLRFFNIMRIRNEKY